MRPWDLSEMPRRANRHLRRELACRGSLRGRGILRRFRSRLEWKEHLYDYVGEHVPPASACSTLRTTKISVYGGSAVNRVSPRVECCRILARSCDSMRGIWLKRA